MSKFASGVTVRPKVLLATQADECRRGMSIRKYEYIKERQESVRLRTKGGCRFYRGERAGTQIFVNGDIGGGETRFWG